MRTRLAAAKTEEQFQSVGLLGRELLISTAQQVFNSEKHPTSDGVAASPTDAKRMLDAYIAVELGGGVNEFVRKHAEGRSPEIHTAFQRVDRGPGFNLKVSRNESIPATATRNLPPSEEK